jgi:UDP-3-O-[3-hydroxymyristoyl] glucosamine N-acyltransferase
VAPALIANIAALDRAAPGDLTFLDSVKYADQLVEPGPPRA